jgi:hypothetical protein
MGSSRHGIQTFEWNNFNFNASFQVSQRFPVSAESILSGSDGRVGLLADRHGD